MFFGLGFLFFGLGWIPLAFTMSRSKTVAREQMKNNIKRGVFFVLFDIVILIAINTFLHFYTELLWFRHLGFQHRFWTILTSEFTLFIIGTIAAFAFLEINRRFTGRNQRESVRGSTLVVVGLGKLCCDDHLLR